MTTRHKITFYYDVVSPWSRVGYEVLRRYRGPWNMDFDPQPINLGYVMKFAGNKPPITVVNKGLWMNEDMERATRFYGVTLNRPSNFPVNTFFAQSALRLIKLDNPDDLHRATEALYEAVWTNDDEVTKAEVLENVLQKAGVLQGDKNKVHSLIERAFSKAERDALAKESQAIVEEGGAFGAPWIVVTRKSDGKTARFFGSDRTEQIASFLGEEYLGPFANGSTPKL